MHGWAERLPLRQTSTLCSETAGCTSSTQEPRRSSVSFTQSSDDRFFPNMWGIMPELAGLCLSKLLPASLPNCAPAPPPPDTTWRTAAAASLTLLEKNKKAASTCSLSCNNNTAGRNAAEMRKPSLSLGFLWLFKHCLFLALWCYEEGTTVLEVLQQNTSFQKIKSCIVHFLWQPFGSHRLQTRRFKRTWTKNRVYLNTNYLDFSYTPLSSQHNNPLPSVIQNAQGFFYSLI